MAQVISAERAPGAKRSKWRLSPQFALVISMAVLATSPACQSTRSTSSNSSPRLAART